VDFISRETYVSSKFISRVTDSMHPKTIPLNIELIARVAFETTDSTGKKEERQSQENEGGRRG